MKKLLLPLLLILFSLSASAQKIHFTDTSNVWQEDAEIYNDYHPIDYYYSYHFIKDTTIDTVYYRKFSFGFHDYQDSGSWVREDTILKKVYIRDMANDSDIVLMDYNLNVGDTFSTYVPWGGPGDYFKFVVSAIDSTLINGVWHRVWHFPFNTGGNGLLWGSDIIEGIGNIKNPTFMMHSGGIEPPDEEVYCFMHNGTRPTVSPAISYFDNGTSCTLSVLTLKHGAIKISPVPASTSITISAPDKISSITITSLLGQKVYTQNYNQEKVQVDIADLPPGIYLVRINNTEVRRFVKE